MNKRLKELYNQVAGNDKLGFDSYLAEKFAELILTDVYDILSTYRLKVIFDDGIEYNCVHPIQSIQKHFRS